MIPRTGEDAVDGGPGSDTFQIFDTGFRTENRISLETGLADVRGGNTYLDNVENVVNLQKGLQLLTGDAENNQLVSSWSDDVLAGHDGDNVLSSNGGRDWLLGGRGVDTLYGGEKNDVLIVLDSSDEGAGELYAGGEGFDFLTYSTDFGVIEAASDFFTRSNVTAIMNERAVASGPLNVRVEDGEIDRLDANGNVIATDTAEGIEVFIASDGDDTLTGANSTVETPYEIHGAAGDDQIFTNGARAADGGDGDDMIFATLPDTGFNSFNTFTFDGGDGQDILDMRALEGVRWNVEPRSNGDSSVRGLAAGDIGDLSGNGITSYSANINGIEVLILDEFNDLICFARGTRVSVKEIYAGDGQDDFRGNTGSGTFISSYGEGGDDTFFIEQRGATFGGEGADHITLDSSLQRSDGDPRSTLDGGEGDADTAVFAGAFSNYQITLGLDGHTIADTCGPDVGTGRDTVEIVEQLVFGDGASFVGDGYVDLTQLEGVAGLSESDLRYFVEVYIAYFDRAPDSFGLFYWGDRLQDGMELAQIARSFFVQPESQAAFPDADDNETLVDDAYANLLERAPDSLGRAYWIGELENGNVDRAEFMLAVNNGARADTGSAADRVTLADKADIGIAYAVTEGLNDVDNAIASMQAYDRENAAASLAEAEALIDRFATAAGQAGSGEVVVALSGVSDYPFA